MIAGFSVHAFSTSFLVTVLPTGIGESKLIALTTAVAGLVGGSTAALIVVGDRSEKEAEAAASDLLCGAPRHTDCLVG